MSNETLLADGTTKPFKIVSNGAQVSFSGGFGGGSLAVERKTPSGWEPLVSSGVAETYTAPDDIYYNLGAGAEIRGVLTGSASPNLTMEVRSRA